MIYTDVFLVISVALLFIIVIYYCFDFLLVFVIFHNFISRYDMVHSVTPSEHRKFVSSISKNYEKKKKANKKVLLMFSVAFLISGH